ncbi:MAG: hypothetical protein H8E66_11890 [Planctomycetes bacterium]|nr:hypothetical protein [Planctomycetota bacterium]
MKSSSLALTWEFWRQASSPFITVVAILFGLGALVYGGISSNDLYLRDSHIFTALHVFCFLFAVVGLSAVICQATSSPQYRFTLPVSIHKSILIPMINGAVAMGIGYLTIGLLLNSVFNAQWSLLKPMITAVCILSVCQAVASMIYAVPNTRGAIVAGVATAFGLGVIYLNMHVDSEGSHLRWRSISPLDIALAIIVPTAAYWFSFFFLTLARRGQVFSMTTLGRWLLTKFDVSFGAGKHAATPMGAELWSEWTVRGRVMLAGPALITITMCCFFLTGRFEWSSARDAMVGFTWMQVMSCAVLGLYLGHVGRRFDFDEHLATRPLSDVQLADIKLRTALKSICLSWVVWVIGLAVMLLCLTLVGHGPASWNEVVPPSVNPREALVAVVMIPLGSWILTSLGVSVVILRPWMLHALLSAAALCPIIPIAFYYFLPGSSDQITATLQWAWIAFTVGGTIALYVAALRLRLLTTRRAILVSVVYALTCAIWLSLAGFSPPPGTTQMLAFGFVLSSCSLPFVCIAAVPLAIWWNRHR